MNEKFTPGPWGWFGNAGGCPEIYLATTHSGRRYVMGFKRWEMNGAQPEFQSEGGGLVPASELLKFVVGDREVTGVDQARANGSVYRYDISGIDAPDAYLIAAAPELYDALKRFVAVFTEIAPELAETDLFETARRILAKARGEPAPTKPEAPRLPNQNCATGREPGSVG